MHTKIGILGQWPILVNNTKKKLTNNTTQRSTNKLPTSQQWGINGYPNPHQDGTLQSVNSINLNKLNNYVTGDKVTIAITIKDDVVLLNWVC